MKFFESTFVMSLHRISRIANDKSMRNLVLLSIVSLLFCSVNADAAKESAKPNVILVLVDDMGWMDLSCQGSDFYRTPNVDRLAKEGILFTNGYAACAVCSPTRAAVQTGRYPHRLGVTDWIRSLFQRGGLGTPEKNPTEYVGGKTENCSAHPIHTGWKVPKSRLGKPCKKISTKPLTLENGTSGMKPGTRKIRDTMKTLVDVIMDSLPPFLIPIIIQNISTPPFGLVFINYPDEKKENI